MYNKKSLKESMISPYQEQVPYMLIDNNASFTSDGSFTDKQTINARQPDQFPFSKETFGNSRQKSQNNSRNTPTPINEFMKS